MFRLLVNPFLTNCLQLVCAPIHPFLTCCLERVHPIPAFICMAIAILVDQLSFKAEPQQEEEEEVEEEG